MNEQQTQWPAEAITKLATTIPARSPFDLRNKLANRLGLSLTVDAVIWATLSRIAQTVWDARQTN